MNSLHELTMYQVDAFATRPFEGNPAAVVPLESWLDDRALQAIAEENNLAETAFFIPHKQQFYIRWFTPTREVELCGHATLASAHILFDALNFEADTIVFDSLSGPLSVSRTGDLYTMDFPTQDPMICECPTALAKGLKKEPVKCLSADDFIAVYASEEEIAALEPDHEQLRQLDLRGVIATAPSDKYDFVVRFFAPKYGIPEDSVTGSAYTQLMPYWSKEIGQHELCARQLSSRGGDVFCDYKGERVLIAGHAVTYLEGRIRL